MKIKSKKLVIITLVILMLSFTACDLKRKDQYVVYTTNYATKFLLKTIGGERVKSYSVYDNTDEFEFNEDYVYEVVLPEDFSFETDQERKKRVLEADAFVYNGISKNDLNVVNDLATLDSDEKIVLFDIRQGMDIPDVQPILSFSYNDKVVDAKFEKQFFTNSDIDTFWISPTEMKNASYEIYEFLVDAMPEYKTEFKKNLNSLIYDLNSLYSEIESIQTSAPNNIIFSDSIQLNAFYSNGILNVSTNYKENELYAKDENSSEYYKDINEFLKFDSNKVISTTDEKSKYYFDLFVTRSKSDYDNGFEYIQLMKENFNIISSALND